MLEYMEYSFDLEGLRKGEWHGGLPAQLRLHFWFQQANMCGFEEDHNSRKKSLDRCYFEIKSKLGEPERKICNDLKRMAEIELARTNSYHNQNKLMSSSISSILDNYEGKIRDYADKHGLTNPDRQDPSRAILN